MKITIEMPDWVEIVSLTVQSRAQRRGKDG